MTYNYLIYKAIHIIFVVSYFAGLFYVVRLMIYHTETQKMDEPKRTILQEQYTYMEKKIMECNYCSSSCYFSYDGNKYVNEKSFIITSSLDEK